MRISSVLVFYNCVLLQSVLQLCGFNSCPSVPLTSWISAAWVLSFGKLYLAELYLTYFIENVLLSKKQQIDR